MSEHPNNKESNGNEIDEAILHYKDVSNTQQAPFTSQSSQSTNIYSERFINEYYSNVFANQIQTLHNPMNTFLHNQAITHHSLKTSNPYMPCLQTNNVSVNNTTPYACSQSIPASSKFPSAIVPYHGNTPTYNNNTARGKVNSTETSVITMKSTEI